MNLNKLRDALDDEIVDRMNNSDVGTLNTMVVMAENAMKQVQEELDANEKYQEIKELKKAAEAGKREVNKRQKALIQYALHLLSEKGSI